MKSKILFAVFVLFCFALLFISCRKKPVGKKLVTKNGLIYLDGSTVPYTGMEKAKVVDKMIEYNVVNGKKEGTFKIFYHDGNPQIVGQMFNNKNEGLWRYYYDSPQLESQGNFKNDLPDSTWTWYFIDGKLKECGNFSSGMRIGKWISYNETGTITSEKYFEDGKVVQTNKEKNKKS